MQKYVARATARFFGAPRFQFATVTTIKGNPEEVSDKNVRLRGIHIKSDTHDAPTLIFFPEILDRVENWVSFFVNPLHKITQQRDIYILYPRNQGTSDRNSQFNYPTMADDVARFMWQHKISTATLAGHGLGGKLALATGCFHAERVTGVAAFDSTPMDQSYHEPYQELNGYLHTLRELNTHKSITNINNQLKKHVKCPKWREIFEDNLVKEPHGWSWNFNLEVIYRNLRSKRAESLLNWTSAMGLWTGRAMFAFPEYSRYVYLNTNTLPMMNSCTQLKGFGYDIFAIQGDQNPLNHWFYEYEKDAQGFAYQFQNFLRHYDGVHVLLKNRDEIGKYFLMDTPSRTTNQYYYSEYLPEHLHHNWRYRAEKEQTAKAATPKKK